MSRKIDEWEFNFCLRATTSPRPRLEVVIIHLKCFEPSYIYSERANNIFRCAHCFKQTPKDMQDKIRFLFRLDRL